MFILTLREAFFQIQLTRSIPFRSSISNSVRYYLRLNIPANSINFRFIGSRLSFPQQAQDQFGDNRSQH